MNKVYYAIESRPTTNDRWCLEATDLNRKRAKLRMSKLRDHYDPKLHWRLLEVSDVPLFSEKTGCVLLTLNPRNPQHPNTQ
jgi:hypothetical protein